MRMICYLWRGCGRFVCLHFLLDIPISFELFLMIALESRKPYSFNELCAKLLQLGDIGTLIPSGDYTKALEAIKAQVLVMPSCSDQYFPPEDSEIEMKYLQTGIYAPIQTIWGHTAGGGANPDDSKWVDAKIAEFIEGKMG